VGNLKEERFKFIPWEDEAGRKRKSKRGDSIPPKTNIQSRVHSKPKTEGQEYLDMYIRAKEKERIERYGEILGEQLQSIADSWRDTKKDLLQKEKDMPKIPEGGIEAPGEADSKPHIGKKNSGHMKMMDWSY